MRKDIKINKVLNPLNVFKKVLQEGIYDGLDEQSYNFLLMIAETQAKAWNDNTNAYVISEEDFVDLINDVNETIDELNAECNESIRLNEFYLKTIESLLIKNDELQAELDSITGDDDEDDTYSLDEVLSEVFGSDSYMPYIDMLVDDIESWGIKRGLDTCDPIMQSTKTLEEVIELQQALISEDENETKDALGDVFVTLVIIALQKGYDLGECINKAYDVINKRKGKIVNGLYVKE